MGVEGVYICVRVFECVRDRGSERECRAETEGGVCWDREENWEMVRIKS